MLKVLVTGATGRQGGAVVERLLARGHGVVALTRDATSSRSIALAGAGARIVQGVTEDAAHMRELMRDVDAVFAVTVAGKIGFDDAEARQGIALGEAAHGADVGHVVFASATFSPTTRFTNKVLVEAHLKKLQVPRTVVAPVYFMENLLGELHLPGLQRGVFSMAVRADVPIQYVSVMDIAAFVVHVLERRDDFLGARVQIAADELTGPGVAAVLAQAIDRDILFEERPLPDLERAFGYPVGSGETGLEHWGANRFGVDIPHLRASYPDLSWHSLEDWAALQDWSAVRSTMSEREARG